MADPPNPSTAALPLPDALALLAGLPDAVALLVDGRWSWLNEAAVKLLGAARAADLIGVPALERVHPEDRSALADHLASAAAGDAYGTAIAPPIAVRLLRPDETVVEVEWIETPMPDRGPRRTVMLRDLSGQRSTERTLAESRQLLARIFGASDAAISISRIADGRILEVNDSFLHLSGRQREQVIGRSGVDLGAWAIADERTQLVEMLRRDGAVRGFEYTYRRENGALRQGRMSAETFDLGGERCVLAMAVDTTDERRTSELQRALYRISEAAHSAASLEALYASIHSIVAELMPAGNFYLALADPEHELIHFAYWVDEAEPARPPPAPLGHGLTEYVLRTGEALLASPAVFAALCARGEVEEIGAPSIDWMGVPLTADGRVIGVLVVQSYTEGVRFSERELEILQFVSSQVAMSIVRKRAEERLRESEARYRVLVTGAPEAILVYDIDGGRFVDWNERALELFRIDGAQLAASDWDDLGGATASAGDSTAVRTGLPMYLIRALAGASPIFEWTILRSDGLAIPCEVRLVALPGPGGRRLRASVTDITDRKRREELLRSVAETVSGATGAAFFRSLVLDVARTLGTAWALVGEFPEGEHREVQTIAVARDGQIAENFRYALAATPCEGVLGGQLCCYPERVTQLFPDDPMLVDESIESYLGMPLFGHDGQLLGLLVALDRRPLAEPGLAESLLRIYATRAAAELERSRAEAALRASEERYRAFVEQSTEAIWCFEIAEPIATSSSTEEQISHFLRHGYMLECNMAMAQMYGHERPEMLIGTPIAEMLVPDDPANLEALTAFIRAGYRLTDLETHEVDKNGQDKYFLNNLVGVFESGNLVRVWGTQRDVTERRRAEAILQQQSAAMKASMDGMAIFSADGLLVFANDAYARIFGRDAANLAGQGLAVTFASNERRRLELEILPQLWQRGEWRGEAVGLRADGSAFPQEVSLNRIEGGGLVSVVRDASSRIAAEEALRHTERQFRTLFEEVGDAVYVATPEGRLVDINPAGVALLGYASRDELLERDLDAALFFDPRDRERSARALHEHGFIKDLERTVRRKDGQKLTVLETATAVRDSAGRISVYRGILRDVTERRALEEQLRQSQKMEAVGRLAGGVAHDFNNLLTAITGYSDLLLARLPAEAPMRRELEEIKRAGNRAADLTRQLLAFSRRQVLTARILNVNRVVGDIEKLLRRVIGEDIQLLTDLAPDLGPVRADAGQLEQVIMNLAVNARDAMPQGGRIVIRTANVTLGAEYSRRHIEVRPGEHVLLEVADNGLGMAREVREHIFEPFFTTKETGRGTGLGLSMVYGIVRQSDGHIEVDSEPGSGTVFRIYMPRVRQEAEGAEPHPTVSTTPRGNETVLVVEDEPAVQQLVRRILEDRGYRVLVAAHATAATGVVEGAGRIHLLLSDVVMPGLSGPELAQQLVQRFPDLRVLYMSGYSEGLAVRPGLIQPANHFLQKPFSPELLARKVREVLDETA